MSNPTYKPSEGKREEFRKYLEKTGVMDGLTKVLVSLYEEPDKPEDALEYIRNRLAIQAGLETLDQMKGQLEEAQNRIAELEKEIAECKGGRAAAAPEGEAAAEGTEAPPPPPPEGEEAPPAPEEAPAEPPAE